MAETSTMILAGEPAQEDGERPAMRPVAPLRPLAEVSVIVVTWNSERWIRRCLDAIPASCDGLPTEVLIRDNASEDATLDRIRGTGIRIFRSATNDGFAAGVNQAIGETSGRFVFLLNPDCELAPGSLRALVSFLDDHPEAAAAAPLLLDERGGSQREFQLRRLPTLASLAAQILLFDKLFPNNGITARYRYRDLDISKAQPVEQPAGAALLLRREVFDEVGPLDEQFSPAWFEDVDYCQRIARSGRSVWVVPQAGARHFGGASLEHVPFAQFVDVWYRNMWRYARKWLAPGKAETLRWAIIAGMILRLIVSLAGFAHPELGRWRAFAAYRAVLEKAWHRWDDSSRSS